MKTIETKESDAGTLIVKEDERHTRYEITTFAGKWRGGKIYFGDKIAEIISGTALVTLEIDGKDTEIMLTPESGEFLIPAGVPNIFYFPEHTEMIETFPKGTETKKHERYRKMK